MNDYMELREHLAHASRAGMPANVPSYYRGRSNVSTSTVNDQARYKLYQEYKDKYDKGQLELFALKQKVATAKKGYDSYLGLKQEYDALAKKVANWERLYKNAAGSTSQQQVEAEQRKINAVKNAAITVGTAALTGSARSNAGGMNLAKGLAEVAVNTATGGKLGDSMTGTKYGVNKSRQTASNYFDPRGNRTHKKRYGAGSRS